METVRFYIPKWTNDPNRVRPSYCVHPGSLERSGEYILADYARALEVESARLKGVVEAQAETIRLMAEKQAAMTERARETRAQLAELRETVESILCLAVEGPEACGYLETVTAITKAAECSLKRLAGVEQECWTKEEIDAAKAEGKRLAAFFSQDNLKNEK